MAEPGSRIRGTVKRMERAKGFGFIRGENAQDFFFHATQVEGAGAMETLEEGDPVTFIVESTAKGPRALQVRHVIEGEEEETRA